MQSANTGTERVGMWIAYRWLGGYGSPSLAFERAPTLRWAWTGRYKDARADEAQPARYASELRPDGKPPGIGRC